MAKYTTAIQGYYLGHNQIEKFVRGEIGTEKESLAMLHKIRKEMKGQLPAKKTKDAEESPEVKAKRVAAANAAFAMAKRDHHVQYSRFQRYGVKLKSLFDGKETIGKDTLKELMTLNQATSETPLFDHPKLKWNSEVGAKAQNKFSKMLLKIDQKKLEYYSECLDKANKPILLRDVFDAPTPVTKTATEADMNDLVKKAKELSEKLNRADSILHVDSSEFKAMKNALKALNQGLMQGVEPAELGGRLEALQAASMNYVKAKGVGMQATQLGKDRMDVALDICNLSVDYMDFYTSNERRKEVEDFEKDSFGNVLSPNINSEYVVAKEEVSNEIDEPEIDVL